MNAANSSVWDSLGIARGGTGALIVADVGQGSWEEIDYEPPGAGGRNYGWSVREGAHNRAGGPAPAYTPLIDPIHEYDHTAGQSITGRFIYRGTALPASYRGRYFFADYASPHVWSLSLTIDPSSGLATAGTRKDHTIELGGAAVLGNISAFGVDAAGELYAVSHTKGTIIQIQSPVPNPPTNLRIIR